MGRLPQRRAHATCKSATFEGWTGVLSRMAPASVPRAFAVTNATSIGMERESFSTWCSRHCAAHNHPTTLQQCDGRNSFLLFRMGPLLDITPTFRTRELKTC
eukprot:6712481-Pyramimonas_sp.AAC.1